MWEVEVRAGQVVGLMSANEQWRTHREFVRCCLSDPGFEMASMSSVSRRRVLLIYTRLVSTKFDGMISDCAPWEATAGCPNGAYQREEPLLR